MAKFRNPFTGRFITGTLFQELFGGADETDEPTSGEPIEPNWVSDPGKYGEVWHAFGQPLNPDALRDTQFPDGFDTFQIRFLVPDNPDYPRGYASYDTLFWSEWPPDPSWGDQIGATGIGAIVFGQS